MKIRDLAVVDLRFPTSRTHAGTDAVHVDPNYSAAYVVLGADTGLEGHGLTFTIGRGNEVCAAAIAAFRPLVVGRHLADITADFAGFWRSLACDSQLRWLGPEKGVIHLALAAIVNAVWDLWAKTEGKPLWKLLADMTPAQLVSTIDFRYITDALTPDEATDLLARQQRTKREREAILLSQGCPAYTTSAGWMGYNDDHVRQLCREALSQGWTHFKVKVGAAPGDDARRLAVVRDAIGPDLKLMIDANQRWEVDEAIARVRELCPNRIVFKQLLQARAIDFCQIDSCRLGGVNENLAVILMAAKFGVPICPHAGGVGLCELVQHLSMFDYVAVAGRMDDRVTEFVDHLHEHFVDPVVIRKGRYLAPERPGFSSEIHAASRDTYRYPGGPAWACPERDAHPSTGSG